MLEFKNEAIELQLKRNFYFSADNSMELAVYLMAKDFMEKYGDDQFKFYLSREKDDHGKVAIKIYKKIKKAIHAIDEIVKTQRSGYDSIVNEKLTKHIDTIWKYRHILWT